MERLRALPWPDLNSLRHRNLQRRLDCGPSACVGIAVVVGQDLLARSHEMGLHQEVGGGHRFCKESRAPTGPGAGEAFFSISNAAQEGFQIGVEVVQDY
jgi:hypothetical protein